MKNRLKYLLETSMVSLRTPTLKQKEAYGRWAHTLSAASMVGAVTVMFARTDSEPLWSVLAKVVALFFWSVVLFLVGAILSKGE